MSSRSQSNFQANASAVPKKKVIFNAAPVAAHLGRLKAAHEAALAAAQAEGKEAKDGGAWWRPALRFGWYPLRKAGQGTQWGSVDYTDEAGLSGRLVVRINGERHSGQIMPCTDEGVARLTAKQKNSKYKLEKR